ncbi:MAG: WYL domain-containing protein [Victivallales bacterium]|nr:WYL domain-containing protein [Victivallales bacterium]
MPKNKQPIARILKLVSMLREGLYPNHPKMEAELSKIDPSKVYDCSQKTIQRDVEFLKKRYHAPIEYSHRHRGYYLSDPNWQVELPLRASDMEAAALGARLLQEQDKQEEGTLRLKADELLQKAMELPSKAQGAVLELLASAAQIPVDPEVFIQIFQALQQHRQLTLTYQRATDGKTVTLIVNPYLLFLSEATWYVRVQRLNDEPPPCSKDGIISLALHRIVKVLDTGAKFRRHRSVTAEMSSGRLFDLPTVHGVQLHVTGRAVLYAKEAFPMADIQENADASVNLTITDVEEFRIIRFVMTWGGEVVVTAPETLRQHISNSARALLEAHQ